MRVIVCGGRALTDRWVVFRELAALYYDHGRLVVIEGGSPGAGQWAAEWALLRGGAGHLVTHESLRPPFGPLGRLAEAAHNQRMLRAGRPDLVLVFPGGRGARDMAVRARAAGVPVRCVGLGVTW